MQAYLENALVRANPRFRLLRAILWLVHWPYRASVAVRNWLYDHGWLTVQYLPVPVVSVGNLTCGGTGKTPAVILLAKLAQELSYKPAVLMRGYKADGAQPADEQLLLEQALSDVPIVAGPDRVAGGRSAIEKHGADLLILDDGFQHRRLGRDLNVVLIDALCPFGHGYVLPRGLLREPPKQLQRADLIIVTRSDATCEGELAMLMDRLRRYNPICSIMQARHEPMHLVAADGAELALDRIKDQRAVAFCGIGRPEAFRSTLQTLGVHLADFVAFADHHRYSQHDVDRIVEKARRLGAALLLTTAKDWVKLRHLHLPQKPLSLYLQVQFVLPQPQRRRLAERLLKLKALQPVAAI